MQNNQKKEKGKSKNIQIPCLSLKTLANKHKDCISDSSDSFISYLLPDFPLYHSPPSLQTITHI